MTFSHIALLTAGLLLPTPQDTVIQALNAAATPLHQLHKTVGTATVVAIGEATHGSPEFFTLQTKAFTNLVQHKGFRTFAREVSWSAGLRLDEYVTHGTGDPRQIMQEEFQGNYLWNTQEHLDLLNWMRAYNEQHPDKVRFMGDDIGYPGPNLFDRVTTYTQQNKPELAAELNQLYHDMPPTTGVAEWMSTYPTLSLTERQNRRDRAQQAANLLRANDSDPWATQHARVIAQSMTLWAADFTNPNQVTAAFRHRDEAMADNVLWWREHTGDKIVLAAHNGHVAQTSYWPAYPRVQGTFLQERLGEEYLSVGTTFHHGTFTLLDAKTGQVRTATVGPADQGSNESTLDRVRRRDYALDTRTAPTQARDWLAQARPTRQYAEEFPAQAKQIALGSSFDVLVHFHEVTPSRLLP